MLYASKRRSYRPPHPRGPQPVAVVRQIIARRARLFLAGLGMAAGRVRGGYPRVSGLRVSSSGSNFRPRICGFGYPKKFGFGADFNSDPRIIHQRPESISPIKAHEASLTI